MNTTVTTCLALGVVCVVAVVYNLSSIFTFALPLMIGMASGLYTSLFPGHRPVGGVGAASSCQGCQSP